MSGHKWAQRRESIRKSLKRKRRHAKSRNLTFESLESRLPCAAFPVTSLLDSGPGTLRDAITKANAAAGADTIDFAKAGTIKLLSALPAITDDVAIAAAKKVTIDGQAKVSILSVAGSGVDASFAGLTLTRGSSSQGGAALRVNAKDGVVTLSNTTINNANSVGEDVRGGAIAILAGEVSLKASLVTLSKATSTEGNADGGAIFNQGTLRIDGSKVTKNTATGGVEAHGGGIANEGVLEVTNSSIDMNKAVGLAGVNGVNGVKGAGGAGGERGEDGEPGEDGTAGTDGTDGGAAFGGGVSNLLGTLKLIRSTVSGNTALGGRGGNGGNGGAGGAGGAGGSGFTYDGYHYPAGQRGYGGAGGAGGIGGAGGGAFGAGVFSSEGSTTVVQDQSVINQNVATAGLGERLDWAAKGARAANPARPARTASPASAVA
jgi:hypothetical protein